MTKEKTLFFKGLFGGLLTAFFCAVVGISLVSAQNKSVTGKEQPVTSTNTKSSPTPTTSPTSSPTAWTAPKLLSQEPPKLDKPAFSTTPRGSYITLEGSNFGTIPGEIVFSNGKQEIGVKDDVYPSECKKTWWRNGYLLVRVPDSLQKGSYKIRAKRSDGVLSNEISLTITDIQGGIGVCTVSPDNGPTGTGITIYGQRFGQQKGKLFLGKNEIAIQQSDWSDTKISFVLGQTENQMGKLKLITAGQVVSNQILFSPVRCVQSVCGIGDACCTDGSCRPKGMCQDRASLCSYQWSFYTGSLAGIGEKCTDNAQCVSGVCGPLKMCVRGEKQLYEVCRFDGECKEGLSCSGGMCKKTLQDVGEKCSTSQECFSQNCVNGICGLGSKKIAEVCGHSQECTTGNCYKNQCAQSARCLQVEKIEPVGDTIPRNAVFVVTFNQLIDTASAKGKVTLDPSLKGREEFRILGSGVKAQSQIVYRPTENLSAKKKYRVVVDGEIKAASSDNILRRCVTVSGEGTLSNVTSNDCKQRAQTTCQKRDGSLYCSDDPTCGNDRMVCSKEQKCTLKDDCKLCSSCKDEARCLKKPSPPPECKGQSICQKQDGSYFCSKDQNCKDGHLVCRVSNRCTFDDDCKLCKPCSNDSRCRLEEKKDCGSSLTCKRPDGTTYCSNDATCQEPNKLVCSAGPVCGEKDDCTLCVKCATHHRCKYEQEKKCEQEKKVSCKTPDGRIYCSDDQKCGGGDTQICSLGNVCMATDDCSLCSKCKGDTRCKNIIVECPGQTTCKRTDGSSYCSDDSSCGSGGGGGITRPPHGPNCKQNQTICMNSQGNLYCKDGQCVSDEIKVCSLNNACDQSEACNICKPDCNEHASCKNKPACSDGLMRCAKNGQCQINCQCEQDGAEAGRCADKKDNDCDGKVDDMDPECGSGNSGGGITPPQSPNCKQNQTICMNSQGNLYCKDGQCVSDEIKVCSLNNACDQSEACNICKPDCNEHASCKNKPACSDGLMRCAKNGQCQINCQCEQDGAEAGRCADKKDNDCDGNIDNMDLDCGGSPGGGEVPICSASYECLSTDSCECTKCKSSDRCKGIDPKNLSNEARCVAVEAPDEVIVNQEFSASVKIKNTGTKTWAAGTHKLGSQDPSDNRFWIPGQNRVELTKEVKPQEIAEFSFTAKGYALPMEGPFSWKMVEEKIEWFGEECHKKIRVKLSPNGTTCNNNSSCDQGETCDCNDCKTTKKECSNPPIPDTAWNNAQCDLSLPSKILAGGEFTAQTVLKNTGTKPWLKTTHSLRSENPYENTSWGLSKVDLPHDVKPQESISLQFKPRAFSVSQENFSFQMVEEKSGQKEWFGERCRERVRGQGLEKVQGLRVVSSSTELKLSISWTDTNDSEEGYEIQRRRGGSGEFVTIKRTDPNTTTFQDTSGLSANTAYTYRIRAFRTIYTSDFSDEVQSTTPANTNNDTLLLDSIKVFVGGEEKAIDEFTCVSDTCETHNFSVRAMAGSVEISPKSLAWSTNDTTHIVLPEDKTISSLSVSVKGVDFSNKTVSVTVKGEQNREYTKTVSISNHPCKNPWSYDSHFDMKLSYCAGNSSVESERLPMLQSEPTQVARTGWDEYIFKFTDPQNKDAIIIRSYPNPQWYSTLRWYQNPTTNIGVGGPSSSEYDGFAAVVDGAGTYIATVDMRQSPAKPQVLYITVNANATSKTKEVYRALLDSVRLAVHVSQTQGSENAQKLRDDMKRIADLNDVIFYLESYKLQQTTKCAQGLQSACAVQYPDLQFGSYIRGQALSLWPLSWTSTLSNVLGKALPQDPLKSSISGFGCTINQQTGVYTNCACDTNAFKADTCWNDVNQTFYKSNVEDAISDSKVHAYSYTFSPRTASSGSDGFRVCTRFDYFTNLAGQTGQKYCIIK